MKQEIEIVKIGIVDDHVLFRYSLTKLIADFANCEVILEANNGMELITKVNDSKLPNVILLDLNMPGMNGYDTAAWLHKNHPSIHILMLTMYDCDKVIVQFLQYGIKGFIKKDIHPSELNLAIRSVAETGSYYSQKISGKLAGYFRNSNENNVTLEKKVTLTTLEIIFLRLASSDLTYKEIAGEMRLNPRAIESLRERLFEKLEVKSRVGLAMFAIRQCIVEF